MAIDVAGGVRRSNVDAKIARIERSPARAAPWWANAVRDGGRHQIAEPKPPCCVAKFQLSSEREVSRRAALPASAIRWRKNSARIGSYRLQYSFPFGAVMRGEAVRTTYVDTTARSKRARAGGRPFQFSGSISARPFSATSPTASRRLQPADGYVGIPAPAWT